MTLALRSFLYTGPIAQGQVQVFNLECLAIENPATPGPGGIIEIFYPNGQPCFHRDIWEHALKLRERTCT